MSGQRRIGDAETPPLRLRRVDAGPFDASLFLITGDGRRPVEVVGLSGAGVGGVAPLRSNAVGLTGRARAGDTLGCDTSAVASSIGWLRDGRVIAGARAARLRLSDADVGARLVCRVTLGAVTVTSAASAPVRPRDLTSQPGAFIDRAVCRSVAAPVALRAGRSAVTLAPGRPVTAEAPLVIRSAARLAASIDGRPVGSGRRIALSPRGLARFGDGAHRL